MALKHDVPPPGKLRRLLVTFSLKSDLRQRSSAEIGDLIDSASRGIDRELTAFEVAVFGLFVPAHDLQATIPADNTAAL